MLLTILIVMSFFCGSRGTAFSGLKPEVRYECSLRGPNRLSLPDYIQCMKAAEAYSHDRGMSSVVKPSFNNTTNSSDIQGSGSGLSTSRPGMTVSSVVTPDSVFVDVDPEPVGVTHSGTIILNILSLYIYIYDFLAVRHVSTFD